MAKKVWLLVPPTGAGQTPKVFAGIDGLESWAEAHNFAKGGKDYYRDQDGYIWSVHHLPVM